MSNTQQQTIELTKTQKIGSVIAVLSVLLGAIFGLAAAASGIKPLWNIAYAMLGGALGVALIVRIITIIQKQRAV